jgi:hypothetical protein
MVTDTKSTTTSKMSLQDIYTDIAAVKRYWDARNTKFKEWYDILLMIDELYTKGMESYISSEPQTFYNMAHYLLTKGDLAHTIPIQTESAIDLDKRAKIDRGCKYMWQLIDRRRKLGGQAPYVDELCHTILVLGWYSCVLYFGDEMGTMDVQVWNPYDTYPKYGNNQLISCVHSYKVTPDEARRKAETNEWNYKSVAKGISSDVLIDDYFYNDGEQLWNTVLMDGLDVTGWVERPEMRVLVAPVGGFPDKGSLTNTSVNWKALTGRGIFEVNANVYSSFNKWKTVVSQTLKDTVNPVTQEFSATPKASPEQIRERGSLFHYAPGEAGLQRLQTQPIPLEVQAHLAEIRREMQKGTFNDAVYGMVEGQAGYALSLLSSSSANQILYPYMDAKHFVIAEADKFWLSKLKEGSKTFLVNGVTIEEITPDDIPDDVFITVDSEVATPKDWMERGTIANLLKDHLDKATITTEILKVQDPQGVKRRMSLDRITNSPVAQLVEQIAGFNAHADYLASRGDRKQADLFRRAALSLEAQLGVPEAGSGTAPVETMAQPKRVAGAPQEKARVASNIAPPEARQGFSPQQLRQTIGKGKIRR